MTEDIEKKQNKGKCQYCSRESGNLGVHEPACKMNPTNIKDGEIPPQPAQSSPTKTQITDIQDVLSDGNVAWFRLEEEQRIFKYPLKCGILTYDEDSQFPVLLVSTVNGMLLPPFMIAGFIGMFPEDQVFPEQQPEVKEDVKQEDEIKNEPAKEAFEEHTPTETIVATTIEPAKPVKKGLLSRLRKQKTEIPPITEEATTSGLTEETKKTLKEFIKTKEEVK